MSMSILEIYKGMTPEQIKDFQRLLFPWLIMLREQVTGEQYILPETEEENIDDTGTDFQ